MFPKWLAVLTGIATVAGLVISFGQLVMTEKRRSEVAAIQGWAAGKATIGEKITKQEKEMIEKAFRNK